MSDWVRGRVKKTGILATAASIGVGVVVLLHALRLVSLFIEASEFTEGSSYGFARGGVSSPGTSALTLEVTGFAGIAWMLSGVVFLCWIYSAHRTIQAIRQDSFGPTPGWAIAGYFIPFLNLVRPYSDMATLARLSDPRDLELPNRIEAIPSPGYREPATRVVAPAPWSPPPGVVGFWWASYIIVSISGYAMVATAPGIGRIHVGMVQDGLFVVSGLLCVGVIQGITACMRERARRTAILAEPAT